MNMKQARLKCDIEPIDTYHDEKVITIKELNSNTPKSFLMDNYYFDEPFKDSVRVYLLKTTKNSAMVMLHTENEDIIHVPIENVFAIEDIKMEEDEDY